MERDATLSNGDDALAFSNGGDETLTLISQHSAADDSHENIGGGGGGRDGEFKAVTAELRGLKAKKQELETQLEAARHKLKDALMNHNLRCSSLELEMIKLKAARHKRGVVTADSTVLDAEALAEELKAERDKLVGDLSKQNFLLVEKIHEMDDALMKLSLRNSSLEVLIIKLKDALVSLKGEIGEKMTTNDAEAAAAPATAAPLGAVDLGAASVGFAAGAAATAIYLHGRR